MTLPTKQFLDMLINNQIITKLDAEKYEVDSLQKNIPIDTYLLGSTKVSKEEILKTKAGLMGSLWVDISSVPVSPQALTFIPESVARMYTLIPFEFDEKENVIKVAMENPLDVQINEFLSKKTNKKIVPHLAFAEDIIKVIDIFYTQGISPDVVAAIKEVEPEVRTIKTESIGEIIKEAPIAKIVTTILEYAIKGRASDVHIEPQETKTRVRYRIDGILQEKLTLPRVIHDSLISRIKILSSLKIDEKRSPQDGRFNFKLGGDEVDLRVSTLPTVHGEKVVMRLLKKTGGLPSLQDLGIRGPDLKLLDIAVDKPYGIVLVTGPTGSGKSTTLYSILSKLNKPAVNILTLEDPVEYQIQGINQVQTNPQAGLTFAVGLRSFLRQDPNIILVGEIRDGETTQLALQAALTGHLVFSTLHTNDAATAIPRLIDLGGEPFLIASVLNAVVGQRIARRLCTFCKSSYTPTPEVASNIASVLGGLLPQALQQKQDAMVLYRGAGCTECANTGYLGRIGIYEVLQITPEVNKRIITHSTADQIEEAAKKDHFITMIQDGYLKVLDGITTIEEVLRVAQV